MLPRMSRAMLFSAQQGRALVAMVPKASTATAAAGTDPTKGPLWQRPVRQEPGKVRMGFVPEEWFQFFYKKTGVTGPYTLGITLGTYLFSKEIYVIEHEFYNGISFLIMWIAGVKMLGPKLAAYLDKEVDAYEASWNQGRIDQKNYLEESIKNEEGMQWSSEGQYTLMEAKRENVALQLEAAYRERLINAYAEVKKRLDYQVEKQSIERRLAQKNLVDWVIRKVTSSITPDQEKQNIDKCIADLGALARA